MKLLFLTQLLTFSIFFTSCATTNKVNKEVVLEAQDYSYEHYEDIKNKASLIIDKHDEYDVHQKKKIKNAIHGALDKKRMYYVQLSKLSQLLIELLINEPSQTKKIFAVKQEMSTIYKEKQKLLYQTSNRIRNIALPIRDNNSMAQDFYWIYNAR